MMINEVVLVKILERLERIERKLDLMSQETVIDDPLAVLKSNESEENIHRVPIPMNSLGLASAMGFEPGDPFMTMMANNGITGSVNDVTKAFVKMKENENNIDLDATDISEVKLISKLMEDQSCCISNIITYSCSRACNDRFMNPGYKSNDKRSIITVAMKFDDIKNEEDFFTVASELYTEKFIIMIIDKSAEFVKNSHTIPYDDTVHAKLLLAVTSLLLNNKCEKV